jgi:hypothetical protein
MLQARVLSGFAGWMPEIRRCSSRRGASGTGKNEWVHAAEYDWALLDDAVVAEWSKGGVLECFKLHST